MRALTHPGIANKLRHIFGLLLCALLFFFAIGAKTAVYRPHQEQVKNLTSAKVWQNNQLPSALSTPALLPTAQSSTHLSVLLTMALLLLAVCFLHTREAQSQQPAIAASNWFHPALAVRPPPSL